MRSDAQAMPPFSRGFRGRRVGVDPARVPPGQYVTRDFPVLSAGPTPHTPLDEWSLTITGAVEEPVSWPWEEFVALPRETVTVDIHCVTKWSKLDTTWTGVSIDTLLEGVDTDAGYVTAWCDGGYTTNLPLEDLTGGRAWIACEYGGEPLEPEHGGPARLLVPHLYFWKSAKWVRGLELRDHDEPGFWEVYGYHNYGDPWKEQRYRGTDRGAGTDRLAARRRQRRGRRDAPRDDAGPRRARLARTPRRPARRRPPHRRGRLPDTALLLDRLGTRGRIARADGRTTRGRRGLAVPDRRAPSR